MHGAGSLFSKANIFSGGRGKFAQINGVALKTATGNGTDLSKFDHTVYQPNHY